MPVTSNLDVNQGVIHAIPAMQSRLAVMRLPGVGEQAQGFYEPVSHIELLERVNRITQPSRRDFVRPPERGEVIKNVGRFGVPERRDFIHRAVPMSRLVPAKRGRFGDTIGNGTSAWQGKGAQVTSAERSAMQSAMNNMGFFAATTTQPSQYESQIIEGAIKFALKHIVLVTSPTTNGTTIAYATYSTNSGLPTTKQTTPMYLATVLWNVKVQAAIGVVRYLFNATNWSDWVDLVTRVHPDDWWSFYSKAIYDALYTYGWLPPKWW